MTKQDQLAILRLLSGVETLLSSLEPRKHVPDYMWEQIADISEKLEKEILS